jgi:hypothetical protein
MYLRNDSYTFSINRVVAPDDSLTRVFAMVRCWASVWPPHYETNWADLQEGLATAAAEARLGIESDSVKSEWRDRLNTLVEEVKSWAQTAGWRTRRID